MEKSKKFHALNKADILLKNGYQVVPIANGKNGGVPLVKGHLDDDTKYDSDDVTEWIDRFPDAGLALCCGKNGVYGLDFDIDHPPLARKFRKYVKKKFPGIAFRVCNPPRFAMFFRASSDLQEISNAHSVELKSPKGKLNRIELMGNRTLTMFGNHRETDKPYRYPVGYSPLSIKASDLPELNRKDVEKIFKLYDGHRPVGWNKVGESTFRKPKQSTTFENVTITRRFSDEEVLALLDEIDGSSRDNWLSVGMALHAQYDGAKKGFEMWDGWASQYDGYVDTDDNRYHWDRFNSDGGITMVSINRMVQRAKKPGEHNLKDEDLLQFALDNWVFVEKPNEIGNLSRPVSQSMLNVPSMKSSVHNRNVEIMVPSGKSGEMLPKRVKLYDAWLSHPDRKTVHDYRYVPGNSRILQSEEVGRSGVLEYYNTYDMPHFDMVEETDLLHHFTDHMKYLFGDGYDMAVNWFAQILQEPNKRYRVALHSISLHQGTGRGWLVNLFNELYGDNVTTVASLDDMFRSGAKNGYLHRSVMVTVNEMTAPSVQKHELMNKLKTMLSDDYQSIDIKYGSQSYNTKVYTRLFGQANGIRDVAIDEDDTRFMVFLNQKRGKSEQYYEKLYQLLRNNKSQDFLNQVYTYLMNWKINYNWLRVAPMTPDKERVIRACKNPTALAFYDLQLLMGKGLFTEKTMDKFLAYHMTSSDSPRDVVSKVKIDKHLSVLRTEKLKTKGSVIIKGQRVNVCSFEPHHINDYTESELKKMLGQSRKSVVDHIKKLK